MFSIGALSRRTGVKVPTIRYYEQIGLLAPLERTEGNQRRYDQEGLERLGFIRHARDLGLPLEMIRQMLTLDAHDSDQHAEIHALASAHLAEVRTRIARLSKLADELERIITHADTGEEAAGCDVLKALGDHSLCSGTH